MDLEQQLREHLEDIIPEIPEEVLRNTPRRHLKALREMTAGYQEDPARHLATQFPGEPGTLIRVQSIPFSSLCEHHLLPFFGEVYIDYVCGEKVAGLSKFSRLVKGFSQRIQTQENLTADILRSVVEQLKPARALVRVVATHTCMISRGAQSWGSKTETIRVAQDSGSVENPPESSSPESSC